MVKSKWLWGVERLRILVIYLWLEGCPFVFHWDLWGCWGCWGHWGCKGYKACKITTGDFRVIQVLELSLILMVLRNYFYRGRNIKLNFSNFSDRGCWFENVCILILFHLQREERNICQYFCLFGINVGVRLLIFELFSRAFIQSWNRLKKYIAYNT